MCPLIGGVLFFSVYTGPESYANGEEVYSLIAGLIALQGRPHILATAQLDFIVLPRPVPSSTLPAEETSEGSEQGLEGSSSTSSSKEMSVFSRVDNDRLCALFFEKLITHRSQETFHSNESDETLTGILRVLLVLIDGQAAQRSFVGTLSGQPHKLRQLATTEALSSRPETEEEGTEETKKEKEQKRGEGTAVTLIEYLYSRCLFPNQSQRSGTAAAKGDTRSSSLSEAAACLSPISRKLAYALLLEVCGDNCANMTALVGVMCDEGSLSTGDPSVSGASHGDLLVGITESLGSKLFGANVERKSSSSAAKSSRHGKHSTRSTLQWEYDPSVLIKKQNMYLGLVNQGCTCYMNAFLQQLFHVESFTTAFLAIESHIGDMGDADDYTKDNTATLFELQILFCYLRLSQKKYCDTIAFAKVFKDYDMEPIRLGEQKDINEYASMLFDKLESNQECKSLIQEKFGGELVWQVISTDDDCAYTSEREEPYVMLTAEVGGKSNLEDSLELYVAGEMLCGDNKIEVELEPEEPGGDIVTRKVDALRRCAIRTLPPVLIVHLKRFEFDLETLNRRKLNDLFTFPTELDMFPYTEEGLRQDAVRKRSRSRTQEDNEGDKEGDLTTEQEEETNDQERLAGDYRYTLKGVVVHAGAIDSGHYYSFVRVRSRGSTSAGSGSGVGESSTPTAASSSSSSAGVSSSTAQDNQRSAPDNNGTDNGWEWMEFNDTTVSPFSMDSIPSECFGGTAGGGMGSGEQQRWKQHSAYMLIYERTHHTETVHEVRVSTSDSTNMDKKLQMMDTLRSNQVAEEVRRMRTESASLYAPPVNNVKPRVHFSRTLSTSVVASISPSILSAVDSENSSFLLDLMRFNKDYILFYWKLLQTNVLSDSLDLISKTLIANETPSNQLSCHEDILPQKELVTRTIYLSLAFCFEVLFRARGQQCIPPFLEKLEDLVARDESGFCASVLLSEWTREPVQRPLGKFKTCRMAAKTTNYLRESLMGCCCLLLFLWLFALNNNFQIWLQRQEIRAWTRTLCQPLPLPPGNQGAQNHIFP